MSTHYKSADDLFGNQEKQEQAPAKKPSVTDENASARRADAALKSSRPRKSAAAFRTISEVANDLGVQQHVLRFWETKFSQVKPLKRGGGRRYYRPEDISLLQAIHHLLYVEGYTIKGVQKLLRDVGKKQIVANFSTEGLKDSPFSRGVVASDVVQETTSPQKKGPAATLDEQQRETLRTVLAELKELRGMIKPKS